MYRDIDGVHYKIIFHACPGAASKQVIDCGHLIESFANHVIAASKTREQNLFL